MFKLYKKLRAIDWFLFLILIGLTFLQVYCTITIVDYIQNIIKSITFLNYHNNPELYDGLLNILNLAGSWDNVTLSFLQSLGIEDNASIMILNVATASIKDVWINGLYMLGIAFGAFFAQSVVGLIAAYIASNLSTSIRSAIYNRVSDFSASEINRFSTPSLITRCSNDVQQIQSANIMMMRMLVAVPIMATWSICKIHATSTELTWATMVAVFFMITAITVIMIVVMPKFKLMQKLTDKLNGVSREGLTGIRVIRAYNAEEYQNEKFGKVNTEMTKTQLFAARIMSLMSPLMMIVMNGITLALYWIGASLINKGSTDYATVTSFMMLSFQIIMSFMMLLMMFVLWPRAQVSAERINQVLETDSSITEPKEDGERKEIGTVEFKDVCFKYPDSGEYIIQNISFKANKGDTIAFVGSTGSGKSTLINLVPRFFDATSGEILVDGVNVKNIKEKTLRKLIGYVPQKGILFTGTVKYNISFGNPEMTDEEVKRAAEVAEADEFIEEMPDKYLSPISQGGKNISGGQKQRISIARAIATKPEILIFDDSFSALDYKTDKKVRENLKKAADGTTKLIVAQRIGTIMDADKIIVLENGEAVGMGTHEELLKDCSVYREIALSQLSEEELGL